MMLDFKQKFDPKTWFVTADLHLNHVNICSATTKWDKGYRTFPSLDLMNDTIIARCNEKVPVNGHLFVVGDVLFGNKKLWWSFRNRIKCENLYLVYGNHDQWCYDIDAHNLDLKWTGSLAEIRVGYQKVVLGHYAMRVWNKSHHKSWCLFGHSHGSLPDDPNLLSIDVGIDAREMYTGVADYAPWSFNELSQVMEGKSWKQVDHHDRKTN